YQMKILAYKIGAILEKFGLMEMQEEEEELSIYAKRINEHHYRALYNYKMSSYDGKVDLFRVKKRINYLDDRVYLGWKPYALQGVEIHDVPGDHRTFLLPPNDKELAVVLSDALNTRNNEVRETKVDFSHRHAALKII